ncbi:MAG TPA: hypothetical protein PK306_13945 [Aquabacterium sp.]|nr:hypothetical protein [Aquabacterium sp.]HQC96801.1 hypothetical protein [Aquabacterium sp.]
MRRPATAAGLLLAAAAHAGCGDTLPAAHRLLTDARPDAGGWQVAFAPSPAPLPAGRHVALDIVVCPPPGATPPAMLSVDADMPAHRHGMNYRASVTALGGGRFRADGLMFHMAGRWRVIVDLPAADGAPARRLTREIDLR